jgi:hypothetical protein
VYCYTNCAEIITVHCFIYYNSLLKVTHDTVYILQCNLVVEIQYVIQLNEGQLQISHKELPTNQVIYYYYPYHSQFLLASL